MPPVRVALIDLSPILSQIVSEVLTRPGIHDEGSYTGSDGYEEVARLGPDVVIVGLEADRPGDDGLPPECRRLLRGHPWTKVLSVTHDGRIAVLYELLPRRTALGEASPQNILETIRSVAVRPA